MRYKSWLHHHGRVYLNGTISSLTGEFHYLGFYQLAVSQLVQLYQVSASKQKLRITKFAGNATTVPKAVVEVPGVVVIACNAM